MGCTDSTMMPYRPLNQLQGQNYNHSSPMFVEKPLPKRPKFLNMQSLNQNQKDMLWATIQRNSLRQFAYILENQRIPSNTQIGPLNTFWNFAHMCARWDAFQCLHYILKRVYSQNPSLILSLMNQQTVQGFTAMHIAIEWNSINCFYLMLDCGGIDLSYCDSLNNDVFAKANLFKRAQMIQILGRFKAANALMIITQSEKLRGFKNFSQLVVSGQSPASIQYRINNQRISYIIDTKNRLNRPVLPQNLPQKNIQQNYQQFYNNMNQIQNLNNQTSLTQNSESSINMKKIQEQRRFQEEQKRIKNKQAEQAKKLIQMQRDHQQMKLKMQAQQNIFKQNIFQQNEMLKIERQKQIIRKNIQAMSSNTYQAQVNINKGIKIICPDDIKSTYEAALSKGTKFVDMEFPACSQSLGNLQSDRLSFQDCVWLRPEQIFRGGHYEVFDGISPEDVKQGALSVCYYLALLSSIAENQQRIKQIFRFYDKELGFYAIQLFLQGKPITMIVDDLIPCMRGTNQPLFSKPNSAEIWVMIFQKAWVKMFGNYVAAQKMASVHMFQNVLPAPAQNIIIDVSQIDQFYNKLVEFDKKNYIMTTTTYKKDYMPPGLVQDHAYSLIGAYNINGTKICKVRNPWGKTQYAGMYAQNSPLWTNQLRQAVEFVPGDDGIFYLTPTQLQQLMPIVTISYYKDTHQYSFIQVQSKSNQEVFFTINVKTAGELAFRITQQNQRFRKNMEFQNSPIRIQIMKLGDNYDARLISEGQPSVMHGGIFSLYSTEDIFENLQPGRYLIRLKVLYDRTQLVKTRGTPRKFIRGTDGKNSLLVRQGKCVLSIYGPEIYVFNRITSEQGQKYIKNMYHNYILESGKASQRLRSVGQDLKPMVLAKDCKMRNQIIYYAQNLLPSHSVNFKFKFQYTKFRNCSYAYNVSKQSQSCEWLIQPKEWNIATLQIDCPFQDLATEGQLHSTFKIVR